MRVLVAEDHPNLAQSISDGLRDEGFAVDLTADGKEADFLIGAHQYNCIVLDTEAEPGSSGGPVVDQQGRVIAMLWGVYMGTSLSMTIHGTTLATELATAGEVISRRGRRVARAGP